ncbi:hypothetical protein BpHYR1_031542, partial [Brachionus plicatilis]
IKYLIIFFKLASFFSNFVPLYFGFKFFNYDQFGRGNSKHSFLNWLTVRTFLPYSIIEQKNQTFLIIISRKQFKNCNLQFFKVCILFLSKTEQNENEQNFYFALKFNY